MVRVGRVEGPQTHACYTRPPVRRECPPLFCGLCVRLTTTRPPRGARATDEFDRKGAILTEHVGPPMLTRISLSLATAHSSASPPRPTPVHVVVNPLVTFVLTQLRMCARLRALLTHVPHSHMGQDVAASLPLEPCGNALSSCAPHEVGARAVMKAYVTMSAGNGETSKLMRHAPSMPLLSDRMPDATFVCEPGSACSAQLML
jgi:hypothetical protein